MHEIDSVNSVCNYSMESQYNTLVYKHILMNNLTQ